MHTLEFGLCLIFLVLGMAALHIPEFVNVLVFRVLVDCGFVFVFELLFVLLETLLIPNTLVCGFTRGLFFGVLGFPCVCVLSSFVVLCDILGFIVDLLVCLW